MKQVKLEREVPFLPEDVIIMILKRLPVKSLIQFQIVCKDWKHLLSDPYFIQEHLQYSSQKNPSLLFHGHSILNPFQLYTIDSDMQILEVHRAPLINSLRGATIIGSINGLICVKLSNRVYSILLWNPAIRKIRMVGKLIDFWVRIGFGFSSIDNDYKIVRISYCKDTNLICKVEVYSLSTSSWKKVEFGKLLDGVVIKSDGFNVNGAIFWFAGFKKGDGYWLVSYCIATEEFALIPSPISAPEKSDSLCNRLSVHENKLALLSHTTIGNSQYSLIDLWVMEEDTGSISGERWSWTKKYSIKHPYLLLPGVVWRNMIVCNYLEVLTAQHNVMDDGLYIVLGNITTDELKRFVFHKYGIGFCVFNYVESLVPGLVPPDKNKWKSCEFF